jgi:succinate-semialdehyde dehydrogenase / glutarate-semialdehyde dehydrogenase
MEFTSIDPKNGETIASWKGLTTRELDERLDASRQAFLTWRDVPIAERTALLSKAGAVLRGNVDEYATMISREMGKPIVEARGEVTKCAWACEYYAEHAAQFLQDEVIETDATKSYVRHDPIGTVFAIMPWNFPFWQVFRFAAPTLTAGNCGLLKHAPNVFGCATQIEEVFRRAGYPEGVFQSLIVHHDETERIIAHNAVRAVTLTGSERAGSAVAEIAGRYLKKTVLELGGSNAFIVLDDADVESTVRTAVTARMLNCGQSCIAAKRFLIADAVYDAFVPAFVQAVKNLATGDPLDEATQIGPLARKDLADVLQRQVGESVRMGATLLVGGKQDGCYHEATVLADVTPDMPAFREETFGPLAAITRVRNEEEALALSEDSSFGLGVTVCTTNLDRAERLAARVSDGAFFVNELVKSDPRLPFGGTKRSGYGRELSKDGMMEFVNRKTVYVK